jgi:3-hydroxyisobutyrate dehydrogenase-like beta-hydroxyacid dehydrogenase
VTPRDAAAAAPGAVALVGLGEVGRVLAEDLPFTGSLRAWDVALGDPSSRAARNAAELGIDAAAEPAGAVGGAELVISAVTAANTVAAAESVAAGLRPGAWYLDLNSASPERKQAAEMIVSGVGARYVEGAVMAPIEPRRLTVPILLGGPHAASAETMLRLLGFSGARRYADQVGLAAATKLCRSIVVKGVEALVTESMLAACAWGVEDEVLASLSNLLPADDWPELARYLISRSLVHGTRRAEEMREAADTVAAAGQTPIMSTAVAERQAWSARFADAAAAPDVARMIAQMQDQN